MPHTSRILRSVPDVARREAAPSWNGREDTSVDIATALFTLVSARARTELVLELGFRHALGDEGEQDLLLLFEVSPDQPEQVVGATRELHRVDLRLVGLPAQLADPATDDS